MPEHESANDITNGDVRITRVIESVDDLGMTPAQFLSTDRDGRAVVVAPLSAL